MNQREAEPDRDRGESLGRTLVGCPHDHDQEKCGEDDFRHEARQQRVPARGVQAIAVGREPGMHIKAGRSAGNNVEHSGRRNATQYLRDDVGKQIRSRKALACYKTDAHRRIQMAPGDVSNGKCHGQHGKPEGERHPGKSDTESRESRRQHCGSTSAKYQPECSKEFRCCAFTHRHENPPCNYAMA